MVTNKSEDDLVYKEEVGVVENHKGSKLPKRTIKPFELNMEDVTGVPNINPPASSQIKIAG